MITFAPARAIAERRASGVRTGMTTVGSMPRRPAAAARQWPCERGRCSGGSARRHADSGDNTKSLAGCANDKLFTEGTWNAERRSHGGGTV